MFKKSLPFPFIFIFIIIFQCIAFSRDNDGIYTIKHDGTDLRRVTGSYRCHYSQWLRDNRIFFLPVKGQKKNLGKFY